MDSKDELKPVTEPTAVAGRKTCQSMQDGAKVRRISPPRRTRRQREVVPDPAHHAPVTSINDYRAARAQQDQSAIQLLDEATRDVHSAASAAMKLIMLARQALGLDQLPRP